MRKLLTTFIGVSCCAAASYAGTPRADVWVQPSSAFLISGTASAESVLDEAPLPSPALLEPFRSDEVSSIEELTIIANKIAYVGSLILTADQVIRSMDSVLNRMALTQPDGTELRLNMRPSSGGFKVMLKLSRPF